MTPAEFIRLGYKSWVEIHWTMARTEEQARKIMEKIGLAGDVHRMCFPTKSKGSDGFYAYWIGVTK